MKMVLNRVKPLCVITKSGLLIELKSGKSNLAIKDLNPRAIYAPYEACEK
jgi:hypothetical protein